MRTRVRAKRSRATEGSPRSSPITDISVPSSNVPPATGPMAPAQFVPASARTRAGSAPDLSRSKGQPLAPGIREGMESHFGHRFANVRIYADTEAATAAEEVNARAYTFGPDIVFGAGQYRPETIEGQRLLAHELTHVIQQGPGVESLREVPKISVPGDQHEGEAERVAQSFGHADGLIAPFAPVTPGTVSRAIIQRDGRGGATIADERKQHGAGPEFDSDYDLPSGSGPPPVGHWRSEGERYRWSGSYGDLSTYERKIPTPYGDVWYWETQTDRVLPVILTAVHENSSVQVLNAALQSLMKQLGVNEERVNEIAGPSSDFTEDIGTHATSEAVHLAETSEGSKNTVSALALILKDFRTRLSDAQDEVRSSNRALAVSTKRDQAATLRTRGEEQEKRLDAGIDILRAAIDVTIGVKTGDPVGVFKGAVDAVAALHKLFDENDLVAEAQSLETEARAMELEDLADSYRRAKDNLKHVSDMLGEARGLATEVETDYLRQRDRAESEFDRTTLGEFRFADVARGIELADHTYTIAHLTVQASFRAEHSASRISGQFSRDPWNQLYRKWNRMVSWEMAKDARDWTETAVNARTYAGDLRERLNTIRGTGFEALVNAPGTGQPRDPESQAAGR